MSDRTTFRKRIRFVMYGRNLTTKQLSAMANLSISHTRNLISGVYCSAPGRNKIEAALGMKIWSDLMPEDAVAQTETGEQSPENDMDTNSNQFAGANDAGTGSPEKNS